MPPTDFWVGVQGSAGVVRKVVLTQSADVTTVTDAIMVDTDGDYPLKLRNDADASVTLPLKAGLIYQLRVYALGATDAVGVVTGLYTK